MAGKASGLASTIFCRLFKAPASGSRLFAVPQSHCFQTNSRTLLSLHSSDFSSKQHFCSSFSSSTPQHLNFLSRSLLGGLCSRGGIVSNSHAQPCGQLEQRRFYQAALRPRLICPGCYFVWRHGRKHVECSDHPRHKQMKRVAKRKMWKEDYTSGDWIRALDFNKAHY
ncbi:ribosomal protein, partial [Elysia marginata]